MFQYRDVKAHLAYNVSTMILYRGGLMPGGMERSGDKQDRGGLLSIACANSESRMTAYSRGNSLARSQRKWLLLRFAPIFEGLLLLPIQSQRDLRQIAPLQRFIHRRATRQHQVSRRPLHVLARPSLTSWSPIEPRELVTTASVRPYRSSPLR